MKVYLFTMNHCPACGLVKQLFESFKQFDFNYEEIDAIENVEFRKKYNIKLTPTVVIDKNGEVEIIKDLKQSEFWLDKFGIKV